MPKNKMSAVYDYFEKDNDAGRMKCKVEGCTTTLAVSHATNLKNHLKSKHRKIYDNVQAVDTETVPIATKRTASLGMDSGPKPKQQTLTEMVGPSNIVKKSVKINMDKPTFEKACIMMVTHGGCSFRLLSSPGFKLISDPITAALNTKMDEKIVREKIMLKYKEQALRLKNLLQNKLVYLKLDLATRLDRTFMGVNIQFEENGHLAVYNLKVLDISGKSTNAQALTDELLEVLNEFDVDKKSVLSITTDNGSNVMKISSLMSLTEDTDSNDDEDSSDTEEDDEVADQSDQTEEDDANEEFRADEDDCINLVPISDEVTSTKCAAHTLDLAADDVVAIRGVRNSISKLKTVVKILRTKAYRQVLLGRYSKKPVLENATRWGSTYDMVKCALQMKEGIVEWGQFNPRLKIPVSNWESLDAFVQIMEPVRVALTALQREALTPGDFYHIWLKMKHQLHKLPKTAVCSKMLERIEVREKNLVANNPLMLAGIYCDVRFTAVLSIEQVRIARTALTNVVLKLHRMRNAANLSPEVSTEDSDDHKEDDFDDYLGELGRQRETSVGPRDVISELEKNFNELERLPRMKKTTLPFSALSWWVERKGWTLAEAAMTLTCLPATQVSVERLFSALGNVLTDKRNRMKGDILDAVLFLRLNCPSNAP